MQNEGVVRTIVREIDDLGRVNIPKEIRRSLNLREGDSLGIFLNSNREIVLTPVKSNHNQTIVTR